MGPSCFSVTLNVGSYLQNFRLSVFKIHEKEENIYVKWNIESQFVKRPQVLLFFVLRAGDDGLT